MARMESQKSEVGFRGGSASGRVFTGALLLAGLLLPLAGCGASKVDAIQIAPTSQSVVPGSTAQFTASGIVGHGSHPSSTQDVTNLVTWTSSTPSVATVDSSGLATGVSAGTAMITASMQGFTGTIAATGTLNVTGSGTGTGIAGRSLLSLTIVPGAITVGNLQDTGQFLAVATFSTSPTVQDVTNSPNLKWISSFPDVFPVDTSTGTGTGTTGGIVTAYGSGNASIIAEYTDPTSGSIQTATATFNCPLVVPVYTNGVITTAGTCYPGSQAPALKATITIYNEGLNSTGWLVTAPSATGTADVIHCGPGWALNGGTGSVCSAAYPIGTTVTLTAPAQSGVNFGGWSSSCTTISPNPSTAAGPNTCSLTLSAANPNVTIGAIFN